MEKKNKNKNKGLKIILVILIVAAVCVLGFCGYKLLGIHQSYQEANNLYEEVETMFEVRGNTETEPAAIPAVQEPESDFPADNSVKTAEENAEIPAADASEAAVSAPAATSQNAEDPEYADNGERTAQNSGLERSSNQNSLTANPGEVLRYASLQWDFQKLLDICEDGVGYIYQKDTPVSYPIVQAEDNNKYLRHMINGEYNVAGSIFVDCNFPEGLNGRYSFIYGHNMDDKSMFGSITSYKDEEYYKKHPEFELYIGDDCYIYYVFSAFQVGIDEFVFSYDFKDDEEFLEKMQEVRDRCPYETDAPEITEDSIVTFLSTCIDYPRDYNYRYVVFLVRGEKLLNGEGSAIQYQGEPWLIMNKNSDAFLKRLQKEADDLYQERYVKPRGNILFYILYNFKYNTNK